MVMLYFIQVIVFMSDIFESLLAVLSDSSHQVFSDKHMLLLFQLTDFNELHQRRVSTFNIHENKYDVR